MRRNRRCVQARQARHDVEQCKCDQGQQEGQDNPRQQAQPQRGVDAVIRDAHPPFESDGEQQVDRHAFGHGLGDAQVRACKGRRDPQGKRQDDGRQQIVGRQRKNIHAPLLKYHETEGLIARRDCCGVHYRALSQIKNI